MNVPVLVQVPIVNGKPDLQLPADVDVQRDGAFVHVCWGDDRAMSLRLLGAPAGQDPVLVGMMSPRVAAALVALGAKAMRLRDAWANPTFKTWLLAHGVSADGSGNPMPPHVLAGDLPAGDV